jgi:hypothetical protein
LQRTFPPSRKKQDPNDREQLEKREAWSKEWKAFVLRIIRWNAPAGRQLLPVPGTWYLVPGTWYLVPGAWYVRSTGSRFNILLRGKERCT